MVGGNKVSPGAEGGADDMKGVMEMGTEGGLAEAAAAKEVIAEGVKGGMAARAREAGELRGETGETELGLKGETVGWGSEKVLGGAAGEGAESEAGWDVGKGREVGGDGGRVRGGREGG